MLFEQFFTPSHLILALKQFLICFFKSCLFIPSLCPHKFSFYYFYLNHTTAFWYINILRCKKAIDTNQCCVKFNARDGKKTTAQHTILQDRVHLLTTFLLNKLMLNCLPPLRVHLFWGPSAHPSPYLQVLIPLELIVHVRCLWPSNYHRHKYITKNRSGQCWIETQCLNPKGKFCIFIDKKVNPMLQFYIEGAREQKVAKGCVSLGAGA